MQNPLHSIYLISLFFILCILILENHRPENHSHIRYCPAVHSGNLEPADNSGSPDPTVGNFHTLGLAVGNPDIPDPAADNSDTPGPAVDNSGSFGTPALAVGNSGSFGTPALAVGNSDTPDPAADNSDTPGPAADNSDSLDHSDCQK